MHECVFSKYLHDKFPFHLKEGLQDPEVVVRLAPGCIPLRRGFRCGLWDFSLRVSLSFHQSLHR